MHLAFVLNLFLFSFYYYYYFAVGCLWDGSLRELSGQKYLFYFLVFKLVS